MKILTNKTYQKIIKRQQKVVDDFNNERFKQILGFMMVIDERTKKIEIELHELKQMMEPWYGNRKNKESVQK